MNRTIKHSSERGIALLTTMLVLMLISALLIGFTTVVVSDQRYRFIDRDRGQAFYAAAGALEKLTADLGNTFLSYVAPNSSQIGNIVSTTPRPVMTNVDFTSTNAPEVLPASELSPYNCSQNSKAKKTVGTNGYTVTFCANASGNPTTGDESTTIRTGPYEGLMALKAPYQLDVTAKTTSGGEVHLVRTIEAVAIPVFQFGMFSDVDLAFNAADDFSFGGRVHTNGNLFLAQGSGILTLSDKVTAVKEVVRQRLSNGVSIDDSGHTSTVRLAKAPGSYVTFARTDGSVTDGPSSSLNEPQWHTVVSNYNGYIKNGRTGAKVLALPLITVGGSNPDLIRRPKTGEDTTNAILFNERLFSKASIRVLLSDTAADITSLPTVTGTPSPVLLDGNWLTTPPTGYVVTPSGAGTPVKPPIALLPGNYSAAFTGSGTTITTTTAAGQPFKPRLFLDGVEVTCTAQLLNQTSSPNPHDEFKNCTKVDGTPLAAVVNGRPLTSYGGITTNITEAVTGGATTIKVAKDAAKKYVPLPFFVDATTLVTCTGYTATTFTGCSSAPNSGTMTTAAFGNGFYNSTTPISPIGGYLKVERQDTNGAWLDVTQEFLNYGIGWNNQAGAACGDPTPNAILRIQRLRDNADGTCNYGLANNGGTNPTNWWPLVLFDTREGVQRDDDYPGATSLTFNGSMYYIALDVNNLVKYFRGSVAPYNAGSGAAAKTDNGGFTVYFSDRRNNRNGTNVETGEYGWEDFVNPAATNGAPNNVLDAGEDVNANSTLDIYGGYPSYGGTASTLGAGVSSASFATTSTKPTNTMTPAQARVNRPIFFRRALKLINGETIGGTSGLTGLTVVSENPVYVQGNYNAASSFTGTHASASVIADAVSVLSGDWTDIASLTSPYDPTGRKRAADTWYRMAIISGKGVIFPRPTGTSATFGTDGGAHSFLRYLEGNNASTAETIHYRGSMATFFFSRQGTGVFKGSGDFVYGIPRNRDFAFDIDFLQPALLPPNTPVFRDMNTVGFSQELRPGR